MMYEGNCSEPSASQLNSLEGISHSCKSFGNIRQGITLDEVANQKHGADGLPSAPSGDIRVDL